MIKSVLQAISKNCHFKALFDRIHDKVMFWPFGLTFMDMLVSALHGISGSSE